MDGGAKGGGQPGVKKNKTMNKYAQGGVVGMSKGTIKGGGKAQRGLGFTTSN